MDFGFLKNSGKIDVPVRMLDKIYSWAIAEIQSIIGKSLKNKIEDTKNDIRMVLNSVSFEDSAIGSHVDSKIKDIIDEYIKKDGIFDRFNNGTLKEEKYEFSFPIVIRGDFFYNSLGFDFDVSYESEFSYVSFDSEKIIVKTVDESWIKEQLEKIVDFSKKSLDNFLLEDRKSLEVYGIWNVRFKEVQFKKGSSDYSAFTDPLKRYSDLLSFVAYIQKRFNSLSDIKPEVSSVYTSKLFDIDISDIEQYQDLIKKDKKTKEQVDNSIKSINNGKIEVLMFEKKDMKAPGYFDYKTMTIFINSNNLKNLPIYQIKENLVDLISHELIHLVQYVLSFVNKLFDKDYEIAGLPSKLDKEKYQLYKGMKEDDPGYSEAHAKSDIEFYTRLEDSMSDLKNNVVNFKPLTILDKLSVPNFDVKYNAGRKQYGLKVELYDLDKEDRKKVFISRIKRYFSDNKDRTLKYLVDDKSRYGKYSKILFEEAAKLLEEA